VSLFPSPEFSLTQSSLLSPDECLSFDLQPARNALKPVCSKFDHLVYISMITTTQCTMHGRRVLAFSKFLYRSKLAASAVSGWADTCNLLSVH
jgi:hypothetical protein